MALSQKKSILGKMNNINIEEYRKNKCKKSPSGWHSWAFKRVTFIEVVWWCADCGERKVLNE